MTYEAGPAAMVRLVRPWPYRFLKEKKWRRLDSNLHVHYGMPLTVIRRSLGRLKYDKNFFVGYSCIHCIYS